MMLLLTARRALAERLGADQLAAGAEPLEHYAELQRTRGINVKLAAIDDARSMAEFGLRPIADVQDALEAIRTKARANGDRIDAILILGGDDVIPFCRLTNPVANRSLDPDTEVLSDNPYGLCSDAEHFRPAVPVGRLSDLGKNISLAQLLQGPIDHLEKTSQLAGTFAAVNADWLESSGPSLDAIGAISSARLCPQYAVTAATRGDLARRIIYCNLHGFDDKAPWRGYDRETDTFVDAIRPQDFQPDWVKGAFVFTEACYGGQVVNRRVQDSCALSAQAAGVAGFIGSTGLVFGSYQRPALSIADADQLAPHVLRQLNAGVPAGEALMNGRASWLASLGRAPNPYEAKTALQFVLYGDPSLSAA